MIQPQYRRSGKCWFVSDGFIWDDLPVSYRTEPGRRVGREEHRVVAVVPPLQPGQPNRPCDAVLSRAERPQEGAVSRC